MRKVKAIFIEAGHGKINLFGFQDKGAKFGKYTERDLVVDISKEVLKILRSKKELLGTAILDVGVFTNAHSSKKVAYINRVLKANKWKKKECFSLSIHLNSFKIPIQGIEMWIPQKNTNEEYQLAEVMINRMLEYYKQPNRGIKTKPLYIDYINTNSILIECGFINDNYFLDYLLKNKKRVAESIANGLLTYLRN